MVKGFCGFCNRRFAIRKDGTLRRHDRLVLAHAYGSRDHYVPCEGSGQAPR